MSSSHFDLSETIAAPASAPGPGARAIVRVSGEDAPAAVRRVFTPEDVPRWNAATAAARHPGRVTLAEWNVAFPAAALLWPNRRSYTGQPTVELHLPGSPPLVEATLAALYAAGVRPARAGEFTLRAFLAGRIDLVQAEAVLGVIDAADHIELDAALRQLAGGVSGRLAAVRSDLVNLLADLEAGLDFVEEDIEFLTRDDLQRRLEAARAAVAELLHDADARQRDAVRPRVVLTGLPNAGKSTLFNTLVRQDAALVSPVSGTTRDWLSGETTLGGVAVELIDTAGWETPTDDLTAAAQRQRSERLAAADVILWCSVAETAQDAVCREALGAHRAKALSVRTKGDLASGGRQPSERFVTRDGLAQGASAPHLENLLVSAVTGLGLAELAAWVASEIAVERRGARQLIGSTAARGRASLATARDALAEARDAARFGLGDELVAAEVRAALDGLAAVLGAVHSDDLLGVIFGRFCIGK